MHTTIGNKGRFGEKARDGKRCERRREVREKWGWAEEEGVVVLGMSPQCSAVSASSAGGAGGVPSPSLPLTQTPMHRFIMDALHWCQRKTKAEIGRHGEKTKERCGGGLGTGKRKKLL